MKKNITLVLMALAATSSLYAHADGIHATCREEKHDNADALFTFDLDESNPMQALNSSLQPGERYFVSLMPTTAQDADADSISVSTPVLIAKGGKGSPAQVSPAQQLTPAQGTPLQGTPAQVTPAQGDVGQEEQNAGQETQGTVAQVSPAQVSPAQVSPAQVSPAQGSPAQVSPAQGSPAQVSPAQGSPAQVSPAQQASVKPCTPAQQLSGKPGCTIPAAAQHTSLRAAPTAMQVLFMHVPNHRFDKDGTEAIKGAKSVIVQPASKNHDHIEFHNGHIHHTKLHCTFEYSYKTSALK